MSLPNSEHNRHHCSDLFLFYYIYFSWMFVCVCEFVQDSAEVEGIFKKKKFSGQKPWTKHNVQISSCNLIVHWALNNFCSITYSLKNWGITSVQLLCECQSA